MADPERVAVVLNGNAKSVTHEVVATIDQIVDAGSLFISRRVEEVDGIARTVLERGYDTVLTGGGDGTFTVVVSAVAREAKRRGVPLPRFGLLRLGTGNSLAWVIGAGAGTAPSRGLAVDMQRLRSDAGSREIRLVEVEGTWSPFCGFGIDAVALADYQEVLSRIGRGPLHDYVAGPVAYAVSATTRTIPAYLVRRTPHCRVTNLGGDAVRVGGKGRILGAPVKKGGILYEGPAKIAGAASIPYYGFGFRMFPYANERADRLQLRISNITSLQFVRSFGAIFRGEYENLQNTFDYLVDDVLVEMDPPTPFQVGGDPKGERASARIKLSDPIRIVDFYAPPSGG